ncbi:MSMEG_1061 family FMN-dependent PPOX-type flavoprotein [Conexibacter woesei]|uniref:MSMEG_1061 family FMN-dependent PPOX-type flavoprotein n=1 Tax=Conexibacter woesei TaxID=191495 RepID=UPI00041AF623|nr:MSMEG_1061 family FMN-dependent PPOX-type flavoprotein [Conexibacter woesei]
MTSSPFDDALESVEQLGELYEPAAQRAWDKDIGRLDEVVRALIAASPLVVVSSHDGAGHADASPRGGQPGFVTVLDDHHLAIPDATGNKRLDTLNNIISTGHAGLLFLIPGRDQTLRVNGAACVTSSPSVLERIESVGKPPRTAIIVRADETYSHCPKAFVRSKLWQPDAWPPLDDVPTAAEVMRAHHPDPSRTLQDEVTYLETSLRERLA